MQRDEARLRFVYDDRLQSQFTTKVSLFDYVPSSRKPYTKEWSVQTLTRVIPKTYVMRPRAAEFGDAVGAGHAVAQVGPARSLQGDDPCRAPVAASGVGASGSA